MLWELWGTNNFVCCDNCGEQRSVVCCGNYREQIVLCVVGIVGNRYFCVLWELWEQILLCVVGIVGDR